MGYSLKRELVVNYEDVLEEILRNVMKGQTSYISPEDGRDLGYWQYKMHTILKSAEAYPDVAGGKFKGLKEIVVISIDTERAAIKITPKIKDEAAKILIKAEEYTERDVLTDLEARPAERPGETRLLEFYPSDSYDQDSFVAAAKDLGWLVGPNFLRDSEEDPIMVAAYHEVNPMELRKRGRDAMEKLGFKGQSEG